MRHRLRIAAVFMIFPLLLAAACRADSVRLPSGLAVIEDGAFENCGSISEVYLPEGIDSVSDGAFDGMRDILWVHCPRGGIAEELLERGIDVEAGTVCRAVLIGQTYAGTEDELGGPVNDVRAISGCLKACGRLRYRVELFWDLTASEMLDAARTTFFRATPYDISVFFYSGHGDRGGTLVGVDGSLLTAQALRRVLDNVPGRKIVILDACFSGGFIESGDRGTQTRGLSSDRGADLYDPPSESEEAAAAAEFDSAFLSAFSNGARARGASGGFSRYYIMTAARSDQTSMEAPIYSGQMWKTMGYFTYHLCRGCGWDGVQEARTELHADADGDGVVSFAEAFAYAKREARIENKWQDAQSNMAGCSFFSPFR